MTEERTVEMKRDIPLDQGVALIRAAQKLNCDTAAQLHETMAKRVREISRLRSLLLDVRPHIHAISVTDEHASYKALLKRIDKATSNS